MTQQTLDHGGRTAGAGRAGAGAADPWRICIAPMMGYTDRHCRYFLRLLAPGVRLYTEMLAAHAVVQGDRARLLAFHPAEHPLAVQLGGNDPDLLARAAALCADEGFDEINLNAGCPSPRVAEGAFGACLMATPGRVARCVEAMQSATPLPVTVKCRIGLDDRDDYGFLQDFVGAVAEAGCRTFIIHARKAFLAGLSPRENRTVPPLRPALVYRLKADFPALRVVLNGGVCSVEDITTHLDAGVDGVMIGRKACADPYWLTAVQAGFLAGGVSGTPSREAVVEAMAHYARRAVGEGTRLHHVTRHMAGLYHGQRGARAWRRQLAGHEPFAAERPAPVIATSGTAGSDARA